MQYQLKTAAEMLLLLKVTAALWIEAITDWKYGIYHFKAELLTIMF